jgi:hypothetical protein
MRLHFASSVSTCSFCYDNRIDAPICEPWTEERCQGFIFSTVPEHPLGKNTVSVCTGWLFVSSHRHCCKKGLNFPIWPTWSLSDIFESPCFRMLRGRRGWGGSPSDSCPSLSWSFTGCPWCSPCRRHCHSLCLWIASLRSPVRHSWGLLCEIIRVYKVTLNIEWVNTKPLLWGEGLER